MFVSTPFSHLMAKGLTEAGGFVAGKGNKARQYSQRLLPTRSRFFFKYENFFISILLYSIYSISKAVGSTS